MNSTMKSNPYALKNYELNELNPEQYPSTYTFPDGRIVAVKRYTESPSGKLVPVLNLRMMTDYEWQLAALKDRLERPAVYEALGEDVEASIAKLTTWLNSCEVAV